MKAGYFWNGLIFGVIFAVIIVLLINGTTDRPPDQAQLVCLANESQQTLSGYLHALDVLQETPDGVVVRIKVGAKWIDVFSTLRTIETDTQNWSGHRVTVSTICQNGYRWLTSVGRQ